MNDLEIHVIEDEPRIFDLDVAARLGYGRPRKIRDIIRRYRSDLARLGEVCTTVGQTQEINSLGGRPAEAFYLNRAQALFIVTKSETAEAIAATVEIVRRLDAYERGEIVPPVAQALVSQQIAQEAAGIVLAHLGMVPTQIDTLGGKLDQLLIVTNELAMNRRVTIPVNVVRKHLSVLLQRRGQAWEADHFFANMSANFEHTWVICVECHNQLTPWRPGPTTLRIGPPTRKFEGYHEGAKEVLRRRRRGEAEAEARVNAPLFAASGNILPLTPRGA